MENTHGKEQEVEKELFEWVKASQELPDKPDYWLANDKAQEGQVVNCRVGGIIGLGYFWRRHNKLHFSYDSFIRGLPDKDNPFYQNNDTFIDYDNFDKIEWLKPAAQSHPTTNVLWVDASERLPKDEVQVFIRNGDYKYTAYHLVDRWNDWESDALYLYDTDTEHNHIQWLDESAAQAQPYTVLSEDEILESLSELVRTISRAMNMKEFVKDVDLPRLEKAKGILAKYGDKENQIKQSQPTTVLGWVDEIPNIEELIEKFMPNQFDLSSWKPKEVLFMKSAWQQGALVMYHQLKNRYESNSTPTPTNEIEGETKNI